jgi:hypothetical protein
MSKDNALLVTLIPLHPPTAKLITQMTADKIVRTNKNLTLKKDVTFEESKKVTAKAKPIITKLTV